MLTKNVEEFIKNLFIRYNDDYIFARKIDKLIKELDGKGIMVLNHMDSKGNSFEFVFKVNENLPKEVISNDIANYVDSLYNNREVVSRLKTVLDTETMYKAILGQFLYINMTGFSIGIRLDENPLYQGLFLETIKLFRVKIHRELIVDILEQYKDYLLSLEDYSIEKDANLYSFNGIYTSTIHALASQCNYTPQEVILLGSILLNFVAKKQLPILPDNWIDYGIMRTWSKLNIKKIS